MNVYDCIGITCITRHRASTTVQAFADISCSALCCHSNETRAPIANPPNSAELQGTLYHPSKLHPGPCSSVRMRRGTDRETHVQTHRHTDEHTHTHTHTQTAKLYSATDVRDDYISNLQQLYIAVHSYIHSSLLIYCTSV